MRRENLSNTISAFYTSSRYVGGDKFQKIHVPSPWIHCVRDIIRFVHFGRGYDNGMLTWVADKKTVQPPTRKAFQTSKK